MAINYREALLAIGNVITKAERIERLMKLAVENKINCGELGEMELTPGQVSVLRNKYSELKAELPGLFKKLP